MATDAAAGAATIVQLDAVTIRYVHADAAGPYSLLEWIAPAGAPPGFEQYFRELAEGLVGIESEEAATELRRQLSPRHDIEVVGPPVETRAVDRRAGRSAIAGEHRGRDAIRNDFLSKVGPLSGGTFRAELTEVAVGGEHVVAVQRATAEHRGKRLDVTACQLMRIEDGAIVEVRGHYSDQYALDDFWS